MTPSDPSPSDDLLPEELHAIAAAARVAGEALAVSPEDTRASYAQVQAAIRRIEGDSIRAKRSDRVWKIGETYQPTPLRRYGWGVALSVLAVVVGVLIVGAGIVRRVAQNAAPRTTTYVTRAGERGEITLPDGSIVSLDVASRLQIPTDFSADNRTIHLNGEALFSVAHHSGAPFTVVTGNTVTRVLGTTFLVRHYTSDTSTTVAVHDGRVAVRSTVLGARQQATVLQNGQIHTQPADSTLFTFASGVLMLNDVSLPQAIIELDRWYSIDIRLGDPILAHRMLHASFAAGAEDLTEVLSVALDVRVVQVGRVLTLYPR